MVKHPKAYMYVQEVKKGYIRVAIYDAENIQLVDYGWVKESELIGATITPDYDWQAYFIRERKRRGK